MFGAQWDWTPKIEESFKAAKQGVAQAQTLHVVDPALPFLLTVQVDYAGFGWESWQKHGSWKVPICFWSQLWKGVEVWYSLIEKQLAANSSPVGQ
mgnify:CR=1 FL=1